VARKLHVFQDCGERRAAGVGQRGTAKTGMKFFGDRGAADDIAAFENERPVALFREIEGRDERVVASTQNDDFASGSHD